VDKRQPDNNKVDLMANISPQRFAALRELRGLTQNQMADLLGVSGKYVGMIERGEKQVEEGTPLGLLFQIQEEKPLYGETRAGVLQEPAPGMVCEEPLPYRTTNRMVPVAGWAHAGAAATYEEIPKSWQNRVPTDCADPKAFGILLEGDSMEPKFSEGDVLIVQPTEVAHSGSLVVTKFTNDGILFRRLEMHGDRIILVALNERYPPSTHRAEEFVWIYPVYARVTMLWKTNR
jgi:repressor LexA